MSIRRSPLAYERTLGLALMLMMSWLGCRSEAPAPKPAGPAHARSQAREDEHAGTDHARLAPDPSIQELTAWGIRTQAYVELGPLIAGQTQAMVVHVTQLHDHSPLPLGAVTLELSSADQAPETFTSGQLMQPGIFALEVTPSVSRQRALTLRVEGPGLSESHELGEHVVWPQGHRVNTPTAARPDSPILLTLEQQWSAPFGITPATIQPLRPSLRVFARAVRPPHAEALVTATREGRVTQPAGGWIEPGQPVRRGQALAQLLVAPLEADGPSTLALAGERAALRVQDARGELDRLAPLAAQGVIAPRRLQLAKLELEQALMEQRSAARRISQRQALQRLGGPGQGILAPSPIEGVLAQRLAQPGAWVRAGEPLAQVIQPGVMWIEAFIPGVDLPKIESIHGLWFEHGERTIELPATALVWRAQELEAHAQRVRFAMDEAPQGLLSGAGLDAHVVLGPASESLMIPKGAVIFEAGQAVVYVQTGAERFLRRPVVLGPQERGMVQVVRGLEVGQQVVWRGASRVRLASGAQASYGHGHAH